MPTRISFADLTHTGQVVAANTFPLGATMVASYAIEQLGDEVEIEVFKYPNDFSKYLDYGLPQIAGFSAFSWNIRLAHEYAKRIKIASPTSITVFGGPNFPDTPEEQATFLKKYPYIDCFFEFEGELSFVEFYKSLKDIGFNWNQFKSDGRLVQNIRYLHNNQFYSAPLAKKIEDPNILPSPHLNGLSDKFYDGILIPMIQSTRGCPYQCTFCWEGGPYFQKVKRFDQERVTKELRYISERVGNVPDLCIVDANFGIFEGDMETAKEIHKIQGSHQKQWPRTVLAATSKNNKERTIQIVELLKQTLPPTGAVQSTNEKVLKFIKRKNVPNEVLAKMAQVTESNGGQSEAEVILCLEGDTKEAHYQTVKDMIDSFFSFVRMYQFMMLPGTKSASKEHRDQYGFQTRFRVLPRCFGNYNFLGETFQCAEIEEIVTGSNTMSNEDYFDCRALHLTVETFHNDSIFLDITQFLERKGIKRSDFIMEINKIAMNGAGNVSELYKEFRSEEKKNTWSTYEELDMFVNQTGCVQKYIDGEYGSNELYKYRALAFFHNLEELHDIAYEAATKLLNAENKLTQSDAQYLKELKNFSILRKSSPLDTSIRKLQKFHYNFPALLEKMFEVDPSEHYSPVELEIEIYHEQSQRELIESYIKQYTTSIIGLGRILLRANMNRLYRLARVA